MHFLGINAHITRNGAGEISRTCVARVNHKRGVH
jgi:hypothetical protein